MDAQRDNLMNSIGLLILRLGVGGYMITHGWGKLQMAAGGEFAKFGDPIGLGSGLSLALITMAEFFCALAVMLGFATRLAAAPIVIGMAVAAFVVHSADPWTMGEGASLFMAGKAKSWAAKEPALLFLVPFLALVFTGPGAISIDGIIRTRRREKQPGRNAAARGIDRTG